MLKFPSYALLTPFAKLSHHVSFYYTKIGKPHLKPITPVYNNFELPVLYADLPIAMKYVSRVSSFFDYLVANIVSAMPDYS